MFRLSVLVIATALLVHSGLAAQTLESLLEAHAEAEPPELEELLRTLVPAPIAINQIPPDSILRFDFLEEEKREVLNTLRRTQGPTLNVEQIALAIELPVDVVEHIFSTKRRGRIQKYSRIRWIHKGTGVQQKFDAGIRFAHTSAGITTERDPGERSMLDFSAYHLDTELLRNRLRLVLGHLALQSAFGLQFAGTFGSSLLTNPRYALRFREPQLLPYRSTNENLALFGAALTYNRGWFSLLLIRSHARRDAHLDEQGVVIGRPQSGLHRTESERTARRALGESFHGFLLYAKSGSQLIVGAGSFWQHFSHPIVPSDSIRQRFAFRGHRLRLTGSFFQYAPSAQLALAGEWLLANQALAFVVAANVQLPGGCLKAAIWQASPQFDNPYGALPGARVGDTANERAAYLGAAYRLRSHQILIHLLRSWTPWRTYEAPQPVRKQSFGAELKSRISRLGMLRFRILLQTRDTFRFESGTSLQFAGLTAQTENRMNFRLQFRIRPARHLSYSLKIDAAGTRSPGRAPLFGVNQRHDLTYSVDKIRLAFRYSIYSVDEFSARLYDYDAVFPGMLVPVILTQNGEQIALSVQMPLPPMKRLSLFVKSTLELNSRDTVYGIQIEL